MHLISYNFKNRNLQQPALPLVRQPSIMTVHHTGNCDGLQIFICNKFRKKNFRRKKIFLNKCDTKYRYMAYQLVQRVLNAAAHVISSTHKFDRGLSRLLHTQLHWLDVPERVVYKLGVMVFNCLHGQAPQYLVELCQPVAGVASRQYLRSTTQQLLVVPCHQLSCYGRRDFCVAGPSVWNSLPHSLRNPIIGGNSFRQSLKTFLFATY